MIILNINSFLKKNGSNYNVMINWEVKFKVRNWFSIILILFINPLASPSAGALALKYGDVNKEATSPGEVKGLIIEK